MKKSIAQYKQEWKKDFPEIEQKVALLTSYTQYLEEAIRELKEDPKGDKTSGWCLDGVSGVSHWGKFCGELAKMIKSQHDQEIKSLLRSMKK